MSQLTRLHWLATLLAAALWTAAASAETTDASAGAEADVDLSGDDWDWGAISDMDAPVGASSTPAQKEGGQAPDERRSVENALPDFSVPPRQALTVFAGVPPFEVIPSQRDAEMHPCTNCHQWTQGNPLPRDLKTPHDGFKLEHGLHGKGKFWCFTCHEQSESLGLKTLEGEKLDFADAYLLCSQCHSAQARDWAYGAHGKRVSGWQEKRQVLNCTACHYQHRPRLKPRAPLAGPAIRIGLERPSHWVSKSRRAHQQHGYEASWKNDEGPQEATDRAPPSDEATLSAGEQGGDGRS